MRGGPGSFGSSVAIVACPMTTFERLRHAAQTESGGNDGGSR
jgi:hypothetical protein